VDAKNDKLRRKPKKKVIRGEYSYAKRAIIDEDSGKTRQQYTSKNNHGRITKGGQVCWDTKRSCTVGERSSRGEERETEWIIHTVSHKSDENRRDRGTNFQASSERERRVSGMRERQSPSELYNGWGDA